MLLFPFNQDKHKHSNKFSRPLGGNKQYARYKEPSGEYKGKLENKLRLKTSYGNKLKIGGKKESEIPLFQHGEDNYTHSVMYEDRNLQSRDQLVCASCTKQLNPH